MELETRKDTEQRKATSRQRWSRIVQPLFIAVCLFLWLALTPMGQIVHAVIWWKTLTVQEANVYIALLSVAAALVTLLLNGRSKADG